jgi:hypothetical protein
MPFFITYERWWKRGRALEFLYQLLEESYLNASAVENTFTPNAFPPLFCAAFEQTCDWVLNARLNL